MKVEYKRCAARTVNLLFYLTAVFFTGCGSVVNTDDTGMAEMTEKEETAENDSILTQEEGMMPGDNGFPAEEAALAEKETEAESNLKSEGQNDTDSHLGAMEIYERFLNGELTVTWEKEQVPIAGLFWDNDIEYCFYDIDGDGVEELHIKDSVAYYAVKVCDDLPQILFEGWWGHEPVVFDGQCGILYYYRGYGDERIQFMTVDAEGVTKKDGEFYWSDGNRNGSMDEKDYFRGFTGWEEIDMEQYVRYRDGQLKKLSENELEWKERQLESFATWQEAYAAYIERRKCSPMMSEYVDYALIYVDDDEIPELYIFSGGMAMGEFVVSFYDGYVGVMNRERVGLHYLEHGGLLYSESGNMGFYPCNIYRLERGEFSEIGTGWCSESYDGETVTFDYFWEECPVTETEYEAQIAELIDKPACVEPAKLYTKEEILEILENGEE